MATEPTKTATPSAAPYAFDEAKAKAKIELVLKNIEKYAGEKGHNPYMWANQNILPLTKQMEMKERRTKELFDKIMALDENVVPKV